MEEGQTSVPNRKMVRFVLQGATACSKQPCFGWIQSTGASIFGSIFELRTDPDGQQGWKRHQWDHSEILSSDTLQAVESNSQFAKTRDSWLKEWKEVIQPAVEEWKSDPQRELRKNIQEGNQSEPSDFIAAELIYDPRDPSAQCDNSHSTASAASGG
ncbi:hypothetical protein BDP27DRAFT_1370843 [Rhodocollybia butyracea]|uniref:Uncharacterized protein n=1 Tax=Rhodocollybia butyracea TaxID=206335 RepID=A0A9P5U043_9AGAR|nr:hypothetical protein BDP27DRAFT_1370843 [Rhodocollybia butyracea]